MVYVKVIFYDLQFVVLTSCEIIYDVNCICSKVICNMVLMFLSQSSIATIFMRLLIKFVIVTFAMCFQSLVWIWPNFGSPLVSNCSDVDPKRDNWASIKEKKKSALGLGLNLYYYAVQRIQIWTYSKLN